MSVADLIEVAAAERARVSDRRTVDPLPMPADPPPMRVLTVRQPWAWAIVAGAGGFPGWKSTENRATAAQRWRYRGPLWIHSAQGFSIEGMRDPRIRRLMLAWRRAGGGTPWRLRGVVLGGVDLVDIHPADAGCCADPWAEQSYVALGGKHQGDPAHLELANPWRLLEPPDARGLLGLWRPSGDLVADIAAERSAGREVR